MVNNVGTGQTVTSPTGADANEPVDSPILDDATSDDIQTEGGYSEIAKQVDINIQNYEEYPETATSEAQNKQIDDLEVLYTNDGDGLTNEEAEIIDQLRIGVDVFENSPPTERASLSILLEVMLLGAELNAEQRKTNRSISAAETQTIQTVIESAADTLREGAGKKFFGSLIGASVGAIGGIGALGISGTLGAQLGSTVSTTFSTAGSVGNIIGEKASSDAQAESTEIQGESEKIKFGRDRTNELGAQSQSNADKWLQALGQAIEANRNAQSKAANL